ncbi:MAG: anti-sigma factor family protein [Omnitrophica WOR_2 bacterium]
MNCDRVRLLLNGYFDGELDLVNSLEIEEHLKGCPSCTQQYQELLALHSAASDSALFYAVPAGFEKRIRASVRHANPAPTLGAARGWRWMIPAVSLAAVALVLLALFLRDRLAPSRDIFLAEEVQSAHVRSLMADHLTDIPSSDQHTVKPWFDGRLDFSPPVVDLATQGFPLIGGRLDYLEGHPVAALVYKRNKHDINLFIWPSNSGGSGLFASMLNGYNLYQWNQSGMTFWAVSDLEKQELKNFVELVQKNVK